MDFLLEDLNNDIAITNEMISEFVQSSINTINKIQYINTIESEYFTEKADNKVLDKLKNTIKNIFSKITELITNLFSKMKASSKRQKVEAMGKKLDKISKLGVDLGKIRLRIPNIMEYDSFVYTVIKEYVSKFNTTGYNAALGASSTSYNKISVLTTSVEDTASRISSGKFTSSDIDEVLSSVYLKYPDLAYTYRTTPGANLETIERIRTAPGVYRESVSINTLASAYIIGSTVISYVLDGITTYADAKKFKNSAPSKIKIEELTVSSLYRRAMNMKLDAEENRLKKIVNNAVTSVTKDMTLQEFSSGKHSNEDLINQAKDMCDLINAYTKFEMAELNYYYDILIEIDTKLSIKNAKMMEDKFVADKE